MTERRAYTMSRPPRPILFSILFNTVSTSASIWTCWTRSRIH